MADLSLMVGKQAVTGMTTFKLLGMASGPNAIDPEAMKIYFNDGSNKLDSTPDSPGSKDPWFGAKHQAHSPF